MRADAALESKDVTEVDRAFAAAAAALMKDLDAISRENADLEAERVTSQMEQHRALAGQKAFTRVSEIVHDAETREAMQRWVLAFITARVERDLAIDEEEERREASLIVSLEKEVRVSSRDAWRGVVASRAPRVADAWLAGLGHGGARIAAAAKERRARRVEVAHRLELSHPWALATPLSPREIADSARAWLDASEEVARAIRTEVTRGDREPWTAGRAILLARASSAGEGWPAHLDARWITDALPALSVGRPLGKILLAPPLGASTFARGLQSAGVAFRLANASRVLPFVRARDPWFAEEHAIGAIFSRISAWPMFHVEVLGLGKARAIDQAREVARALFLSLRVLAAQAILSFEAHATEEWEEITRRAFGAPLPAGLAGAWPRERPDMPTLWLAALDADHEHRALVDSFDEDWWKNPLAARALVARAQGPSWRTRDADPMSRVRALAKRAEELVA